MYHYTCTNYTNANTYHCGTYNDYYGANDDHCCTNYYNNSTNYDIRTNVCTCIYPSW
jgi:hypothetical protein